MKSPDVASKPPHEDDISTPQEPREIAGYRKKGRKKKQGITPITTTGEKARRKETLQEEGTHSSKKQFGGRGIWPSGFFAACETTRRAACEREERRPPRVRWDWRRNPPGKMGVEEESEARDVDVRGSRNVMFWCCCWGVVPADEAAVGVGALLPGFEWDVLPIWIWDARESAGDAAERVGVEDALLRAIPPVGPDERGLGAPMVVRGLMIEDDAEDEDIVEEEEKSLRGEGAGATLLLRLLTPPTLRPVKRGEANERPGDAETAIGFEAGEEAEEEEEEDGCRCRCRCEGDCLIVVVVVKVVVAWVGPVDSPEASAAGRDRGEWELRVGLVGDFGMGEVDGGSNCIPNPLATLEAGGSLSLGPEERRALSDPPI
ncbi:hypothetical protein DL93DRAFT_2098567 [Clavulina sp. PMI_390]|nr:hypothetical protein DL93DRAFT_2098567 [Clavulina sp. PMI_390]